MSSTPQKINLRIIEKKIEHKQRDIRRKPAQTVHNRWSFSPIQNSNFNYSIFPASTMKIAYNIKRDWVGTKNSKQAVSACFQNCPNKFKDNSKKD